MLPLAMTKLLTDEETLRPNERATLRELIDDVGEREAARYLRVSRQTQGRALAGLALQRGTVMLLRERLRAHAGGQS
jgi:hypothetical protein